MRILSVSLLIIGSVAAGEASLDALYEQGLAAMRSGDNVTAVKTLSKAITLAEASGDEARATELGSMIFWARKKLNLHQIEFLNQTDSKAAQKAEAVVNRKVDTADADKALQKAISYASSHQDDQLMVAVKLFEVANLYKGTDVGFKAMDLCLAAMAKVKTEPAKAVAKPPVRPSSTTQPVFKIGDIERESFSTERKALLEKAKTERDRSVRANLLIDAAKLALKLGDFNAISEFDAIARESAAVDYGNPASRAIMAKAEFLSASGNWKEAEANYSTIWKRYKGSYGNSGCEAANVVAKHYEDIGQMDAAATFKEIVIECGGSYGDAAAEACFWLSDYFKRKGDNVKAYTYLRKVSDKFHGSYGNQKAKAEQAMKEFTQGR